MCRSLRRLSAYVFVVLVAAPLAAQAQEWTRFRGPNGSGVSTATTVPTSWTEADYNWKVELPGQGHSSPVVWGHKLFLTSAEEDGARRLALCVDTSSGKILWQREFPFGSPKKHLQNSYASSTPAVDAERVYFALADDEHYLLKACDHDGNDVWQYDLGPFQSQHGSGTSPIVYEDMVLLGNDQDGPSYLLALDRRTGEKRWQAPRKSAVVAYSTPCVYQPAGGPPELIFLSEAHGVTSLDPHSGQVNWEFSAFDKRTVSSPVIAGDLILGACGSGAGGNYVAAVRPGKGSEAPEEVYRVKKSAPYVPTSVAKGDLVFLWGDAGVVSCIEAADGEVVWQKRIGGNYSGSPICVGEALLNVSADGEVVVLRAGRAFEELGRMPLGEEFRSSPSVAGGRLYLRTVSHLFSIGGK